MEVQKLAPNKRTFSKYLNLLIVDHNKLLSVYLALHMLKETGGFRTLKRINKLLFS